LAIGNLNSEFGSGSLRGKIYFEAKREALREVKLGDSVEKRILKAMERAD
jgi:hypothetical protein